MRSLLLALLVVCCAPAGWAHNADVPSRDALIEELRGINLQLKRARTLLDGDLSLDQHDLVTRLNQAQVWFYAEDYPKAALRLLQLIARPGFETSRAYPEALTYLADALWAIELRRAAVKYQFTAIQQPNQAESAWRRRFDKLLDIADDQVPLSALRAAWARYQKAPAEGVLGARIHYRYARALFRRGQVGEARALFDAVQPDDPFALQARYFVGVTHIKLGELLDAQKAFDAALALHQAREPRVATDSEVLDALPRKRVVQVPNPHEPELDPVVRARRRMGSVIHMALARLAAAQDDHETAWAHYRRIPRGDPDHAAALSEATFVLVRRDEFEWCARLVDQLLAGRGQDLSAAQLTLWKYQLIARSARYADAKAGYETFEAELSRRAEAFEAELQEGRLFPAAVLAWTSPADADRVRHLEADLVIQREAIIEARELLAELEALARSGTVLPVVAHGQEVHARLTRQMTAFDAKLGRAAAAAHGDRDGALHGGGPAATQRDVSRIRGSLGRLRARLDVFGGHLNRYEGLYRQRLNEVLRAETPNLRALDSALAAEEQSARTLAGDLRVAAKANLERFAAEARFGQVDLAYWRKQEITRRIQKLHEQKAKALPDLDAPIEPPKAPAPPEDAAPEPVAKR